MNVVFACLCSTCVPFACRGQKRVSEKVPRNESNRQLSYHMMLGTESGTSGRVISLLVSGAIPPAPWVSF